MKQKEIILYISGDSPDFPEILEKLMNLR
jgi:hypothetical protein